MKKLFLKHIVIVLVLLSSIGANAQCAMCRAALASNEEGVKPEAVNDGIVYLMIFPYLLIGLVGFAVYRLRKKALQNKEAQ